MHANLRQILLATVAVVTVGVAHAQTPLIKPQLQIPQQKLPLNPALKPEALKPQGCPDLAIPHVRVYISQPQADGRERINFMVQIRNNGNLEYRHASANATEIHLYQQDTAGGRRVFDQRPINAVRPGGGINYFSRYILWSRSVEFPPNVVAEIRYLDPDFGADGSRTNDDCRMTNNRFVLRGAEINRALDSGRVHRR